MKKFLLAGIVILGSIGYVFLSRTTSASSMPLTDTVTTATQTSSDATPITSTSVPSTTPAPTSVPTSTKTTTPTPVVATTPAAPKGLYKDGTYVGSVADAYYGNVQVEAIVSGGRLTNIKVLQYPSDRNTSIRINQQALPMLIQEAISAQASSVNAISGASDTSPAFMQSLHTALLAARA